jgi:hypothetical protein
MKFDKEVRKEAESCLNQVLLEAEVKRLIRQEVEKFMAASLTNPPVKLDAPPSKPFSAKNLEILE